MPARDRNLKQRHVHTNEKPTWQSFLLWLWLGLLAFGYGANLIRQPDKDALDTFFAVCGITGGLGLAASSFMGLRHIRAG